MKHIRKGDEPAVLIAWKQANRGVQQNLRFDNLPTPVKTALKQQMLVEQGYLCAYVMVRLSSADHCHIEHIEPQNQSRAKELEYSNMLACFPAGRSHKNYTYGACRKSGQHISSKNFVSPLDANVEQKFFYKYDGSVEATDNDPAAHKTLLLLGLNDPQLRDLRRAAIEAAGVSRFSAQPLPADAARKLAQDILLPNVQGQLPVFCLAISQVALAYAQREDGNKATGVF